VSTKKLVFAVSLASAVALGAGVFLTSEVRAGALENPTDTAQALAQGISAVDAAALDQARAFEGQWSYIGGQKQRDGIEDAIAASMDAVSPLLRKIGTKRLRESNPVPEKISFALDGETMTITLAGDSHKAKLDGTPVKTVSSKGDKTKISHKVRGSKLIQFIDGKGGDRSNTFRLNDDGTRLYLDAKITSSHLPVPCAYRLTFKRK